MHQIKYILCLHQPTPYTSREEDLIYMDFAFHPATCNLELNTHYSLLSASYPELCALGSVLWALCSSLSSLPKLPALRYSALIFSHLVLFTGIPLRRFSSLILTTDSPGYLIPVLLSTGTDCFRSLIILSRADLIPA